MGVTGCRMAVPSRHSVDETVIHQLQMNTPPPPPPPDSGGGVRRPQPDPPPAPKPPWITCDCATAVSWAWGNPELKPVGDREILSQRADRDRMDYPLPVHDHRCLVMEMMRPSLDYPFTEAQLAHMRTAMAEPSPTLTSAFVDSLDDAGVRAVYSVLVSDPVVHGALELQPPALLERVEQVQRGLDPEDLELMRSALVHIAKELTCRNGKLVQFTPGFTSCTKSNTAPYFLGTAEQARSAIFYVIKYVTKDKISLSGSMSVLLDARKHIDMYPSGAADTGTVVRTGIHFLQRTLNTLAGSAEFGGSQASSITLGYPGSYISHEFEYVFVWDLVRWIKQHQQGSAGARTSGGTVVVPDAGLPDVPEEEDLLYDFPGDEFLYNAEEMAGALRDGAFNSKWVT